MGLGISDYFLYFNDPFLLANYQFVLFFLEEAY